MFCLWTKPVSFTRKCRGTRPRNPSGPRVAPAFPQSIASAGAANSAFRAQHTGRTTPLDGGWDQSSPLPKLAPRGTAGGRLYATLAAIRDAAEPDHPRP